MQTNTMHLVCIYEHGYRVALLAKEGRVHNHFVVMGCPIDVVKRPADVEDFEYLGGDVARARAQFLDAAARLGITARARTLLEAGRASPLFLLVLGVVCSLFVACTQPAPAARCTTDAECYALTGEPPF